MFGKKQKRIDELESQNNELRNRLAAVEPYEDVAKAIVAEVATHLATSPHLTTSQIFEAAKAAILESTFDEAEARLINEYIDAHIDELFDSAVEAIKLQQGDELFAEARLVVETDPRLRTEIANRALQEAREEALMDARNDLAELIRATTDAERKRLSELNKYRLELHRTTEMNLADQKLAELLEHGDRMRLLYDTKKGPASSKGYVELRWYEDSKTSKGGWLYDNASHRLLHKNGNSNTYRYVELEKSAFITIGVVGHSTNTQEYTGSETTLSDKLKLELPIYFSQRTTHSGYKRYDLEILQDSESSRLKLADILFIPRQIEPTAL